MRERLNAKYYWLLHLKYSFLSGFILNILLFQKFSFPRECQCLSWYDWFAKWELLRFDKWPKSASGEQTPSNHFHPLPFNFGQNIIWNWKVKLYRNLDQSFLQISDVIKYIIPWSIDVKAACSWGCSNCLIYLSYWQTY